jgi:hypothetical protein
MKTSSKLAEIIGISLGDGCISITKNYHEYAVLGDRIEERSYYDSHVLPLLNKNLFKPLIGKEVPGKEYLKSGVYGFYLFNKKVVDYLLSLGLNSGSKLNAKIPSFILKDKKNQNYFLRGLFDTDGTIYFNKNYSVKLENRKHNQPRIKLGITSRHIAEKTKEILISKGYNPYWQPPYLGKKDKNPIYTVMIRKREDFYRYVKEIGFKSPKHLTKLELFQKQGFCPPYTTIKQREWLLRNIP